MLGIDVVGEGTECFSQKIKSVTNLVVWGCFLFSESGALEEMIMNHRMVIDVRVVYRSNNKGSQSVREIGVCFRRE